MPDVPGISRRIDSAAVSPPDLAPPSRSSTLPRSGPAVDLALRKAPDSGSPRPRRPTQLLELPANVLSQIADDHLPRSDAARLAVVNKELRRTVGDPLPPLQNVIEDLHQLPVNGGSEQAKELMKQVAGTLDKAADPRELRVVMARLHHAAKNCRSPVQAELLALLAGRIDRLPGNEPAVLFDALLKDTLVLAPSDMLTPLQALSRRLDVCPPERQPDTMRAMAYQTQRPPRTDRSFLGVNLARPALTAPEQAQLLLTLAGQIGSMASPITANDLLGRAVEQTVSSPEDRTAILTESSRQLNAMYL